MLLDFLQNDKAQPNQVLPNLALAEGKFSIKKQALGRYQYAYFYLRNENGRLVHRVVNAAPANPTTDLRLKEQRRKGSVFRYARDVDYFPDGSVFEIPHVQKQEFSLIETLGELHDVCKMIYGLEALDEWRFLSGWGRLSDQEKLQKYDKLCSHEFHLFVFFKDRSFFEGVVLPFVANKREKTLVDFFLLGDQRALQRWMCVSELERLNVLERTLLYFGAAGADPEFAQLLLEDTQMRAKMNKIADAEYKRNFDSILQSAKKEDPEAQPDSFSNIANVPVQMMAQCYQAPPPMGMYCSNFSNFDGERRTNRMSSQGRKKMI